jgi:hypothetical protein
MAGIIGLKPKERFREFRKRSKKSDRRDWFVSRVEKIQKKAE